MNKSDRRHSLFSKKTKIQSIPKKDESDLSLYLFSSPKEEEEEEEHTMNCQCGGNMSPTEYDFPDISRFVLGCHI